jgi:hypothetical protein
VFLKKSSLQVLSLDNAFLHVHRTTTYGSSSVLSPRFWEVTRTRSCSGSGSLCCAVVFPRCCVGCRIQSDSSEEGNISFSLFNSCFLSLTKLINGTHHERPSPYLMHACVHLNRCHVSKSPLRQHYAVAKSSQQHHHHSAPSLHRDQVVLAASSPAWLDIYIAPWVIHIGSAVASMTQGFDAYFPKQSSNSEVHHQSNSGGVSSTSPTDGLTRCYGTLRRTS